MSKLEPNSVSQESDTFSWKVKISLCILIFGTGFLLGLFESSEVGIVIVVLFCVVLSIIVEMKSHYFASCVTPLLVVGACLGFYSKYNLLGPEQDTSTERYAFINEDKVNRTPKIQEEGTGLKAVSIEHSNICSNARDNEDRLDGVERLFKDKPGKVLFKMVFDSDLIDNEKTAELLTLFTHEICQNKSEEN